MSLVELLIYLLIAAVCGAIGQSIAGFDLGGCFVSIIVGFIGAWIGQYIAHRFGFPEIFAITIGGKTFPIVWAVIGSAIFTLIIGLIRGTLLGRRP